ncbi:MAG: DUF4349 domain-containing protein [Actinomycetota bacterium]|nr:DUF4349 domain-containing protein [Actinomycetota bacterium]
MAIVIGGAVVACTSSAQTAARSAASNAAAAPPAGPAGGAGPMQSAAAGGSGAAASAPASSAAGSGALAAGSGGSGSAAKPARNPVVLPPIALDGRQIIRTGSFTLAVTVRRTANASSDQNSLQDKVSGMAIRVRAVATSVGGYVSASDGSGATQSITMRIPVSQYDAARQRLGELGTLDGSESTQDVTGQLADLDGRLETMKDGVVRVRQLLTKATKISDVIAIESELSSREATLESTTRQRAAMADQVALSTITMVITGTLVGPVPKPHTAALVKWAPMQLTAAGPSGFTGGVLAAYGVLMTLGKGIATFIGGLLPFLPFLIIIVLLIPWFRRRFADARQIVTQPAVPTHLGRPATRKASSHATDD